ncbi:hypothetical protein DIS24_g5929 [Lasiodiplodia hormozganensis]|uniref:Cupin type-2 domain-containing protein n=1 Tax=Lasiodiplodia hormozganensis TaxID=869390 RepID=A0AA40CW02_9PEZI|nr:hypothetical protein DIS24_g5929 [Lasiodiplodia hormozganensis]
MPSTIIRNTASASSSSSEAAPSTRKGDGAHFVGDVWIDAVFADAATATTAVSVANVTFTPCARTNWHTHRDGQVLRVLAGSGWIADKGGEPRRVRTGDMVWSPPGTVHWHGADDGAYMTHLAVTLGTSDWHEAVSDEEYAKKG